MEVTRFWKFAMLLHHGPTNSIRGPPQVGFDRLAFLASEAAPRGATSKGAIKFVIYGEYYWAT